MDIISREMKDIAIFGAGGFGREIACLINRINNVQQNIWNLIGFFDDDESIWGTKNEYGEILGGKGAINAWDRELSLIITIGNPQVLPKMMSGITNPNISYPNIIDPTVDFLDPNNVRMGKGNVICAKCFVSCNVKMGDFNLFNVGAGIGHDATIGNYNVVMPNVNISGGVTIGNGNLFGVKSTVMQYLKIGDGITLGANSLLIKSAKDKALYMGAPAKKIII